jgi:hypothetical protein
MRSIATPVGENRPPTCVLVIRLYNCLPVTRPAGKIGGEEMTGPFWCGCRFGDVMDA